MKIVGATDTGFRRSDNQDKYIAGQLGNGVCFAFVCDGMGGVAGGSVASAILSSTLEEFLFMQSEKPSIDDEKIIMDAIDNANREIFFKAKKEEALAGMGTTVSGLTINGNRCNVYNAGDSRVYILRSGNLVQITEDHSVVMQLYKQGKITLEELSDHPQKNLITRAVGVDESVEIDISEVSLEKGDRLLCASDGLTNFVSEEQITALLSIEDIFVIPQKLIEKALENKASDNITAVVLEF